MSRIIIKSGKQEIAAVLAPLALSVFVFSASAKSVDVNDQQPLTFDSVGSMLQDMDREQSMAVAEPRSGSRARLHTDGQACQSEDVEARMNEAYEHLQEQIAHFDFDGIEQLEAEVITRYTANADATREERAAFVREARASAKAVTAELRAAMAALEESRIQVQFLAEERAAAVQEAALNAVEPVLANQPD